MAVVGGGSWGTALAISLAGRFEQVSLWVRRPESAQEMTAVRENRRYLPGFQLPANIQISAEASIVLPDADIALLVVPSGHLRSVLTQLRPVIDRKSLLVSATKGLEEAKFGRMTEVIADVLQPDRRVAALSGPTFAREIALGEPTAVVVASEDAALASSIQKAFSTASLRLYTSSDVIGVELGAALKNVIAIGSGICSGLGLGSNSVAALITRGLAEITRLAVDMGGSSKTLSGLAGLGDLVLTATGDLSRNRNVGMELARGRTLSNILEGMTMVAEGVETCRAAHLLSQARGISMPIVTKMHQVLYEGKNPREAIRELMDRPLTTE